MSIDSFDYTTTLGSARFTNPIFTASGCASSGKELSQFFDLRELGAIVTKSIMLSPRSGRPVPRMAETPSGMLNSIGLQGPGIEYFLENDLSWLIEKGATVVVSIAGNTVDEYGELAARLRGVGGIRALEVNISCPNVENRGQVFACHPDTAHAAIANVRRNIGGDVPIVAKLSPDVTEITSIAESVVNAGADGFALINTVLGMVIDTKAMRPLLAGKTGGLSGPAIRPIAVRAIYQVHARFPQKPILGMGGVASGEDALELIMAGASAVSIGTANFHDPLSTVRIKAELREELMARGFDSLRAAIGIAHKENVL